MQIKNFVDSNKNIKIVEQRGIFSIIEHQRDLSVHPTNAQTQFFMSEMNCKRRQILISLKDNAIRLKPGAMQMIFGDITAATGVTGVGDLFKKGLKSQVTGDAAIKPLYKGNGYLITEPEYSYFLIEDMADWGDGMVCDDGSFVCCDDEIKDTVVARTNLSSAVFGGEGLFNLCLQGAPGYYAVIKSPCPKEELYEITLTNETIKIDGNNAIAWSKTLNFTVEKTTKTLIGSAASGEGLVNVFRGTGKILVRP